MSEHTLELNTVEMKSYVDFLREKSTELQILCKQFDEDLLIAAECMDQLSGKTAAMALARNMENIKKNIPRMGAAAQPIMKAQRLAEDASRIFSAKFKKR